MDRCKEVLAGYSLQYLPNLSGRRFPPGVVHTAVAALPLPFSQNTGYGLYHILSQAAVSAAISRVIGAYSDSTDVLLCISSGHDSSLKPVRVSWDEHRTWQDVVFNTARIFGDPAWPSVPRYTLHTLLGVSERDAILPLAVVHFGNPSEGRSTGGFALTLSINPSNSSISLTVSDRVMHEMSADLFLSQVIAVCNTALDDSFSPVSTLRGLPDLLNSTFEKCTPGEREHLSPIPYVRFATDYLSLCAISVPDRTAARWYPHLSLDLSPFELYFDSITYGDWDRRANQAARWLLSLGLQREDRVAVCMERNISFHIAFVAILRAGGCYVPVSLLRLQH